MLSLAHWNQAHSKILPHSFKGRTSLVSSHGRNRYKRKFQCDMARSLPNLKYKTPCKSIIPRVSLDLQGVSWLVVCQRVWEHTFRNMFGSICQAVGFYFGKNEFKKCTGLPPPVTNTCIHCVCSTSLILASMHIFSKDITRLGLEKVGGPRLLIRYDFQLQR